MTLLTSLRREPELTGLAVHARLERRGCRPFATAAVALAGLLAYLSPATAAGPATAPVAPVPVLDWQPCAAPGQQGFECATAQVPLDYGDPQGATIDLAVIKHPATSPAQRLGALFFNPGGPGGAGTVGLPRFLDGFPATLRARFDLLSWDPRGVGASTAVQCFATSADEERFFAGGPLQPLPRGPGREASVDPEVWTTGGEERTFLSTFLRQGSDKASALALDGFLDLCGQASIDQCAFSAGSASATREKWTTLLQRLREQPVTLGSPPRTFTYAVLASFMGEQFGLFSYPGWTETAALLQNLWTNSDPSGAPTEPTAAAASLRTTRSAGPLAGRS